MQVIADTKKDEKSKKKKKKKRKMKKGEGKFSKSDRNPAQNFTDDSGRFTFILIFVPLNNHSFPRFSW